MADHGGVGPANVPGQGIVQPQMADLLAIMQQGQLAAAQTAQAHQAQMQALGAAMQAQMQQSALDTQAQIAAVQVQLGAMQAQLQALPAQVQAMQGQLALVGGMSPHEQRALAQLANLTSMATGGPLVRMVNDQSLLPPPAVWPAGMTELALSALPVVHLRALCQFYGLPAGGNRQVVMDRVKQFVFRRPQA